MEKIKDRDANRKATPTHEATKSLNPIRDAAHDYGKRGWKCVPIPSGEKSPKTKEWQLIEFVPTSKNYSRWHNLGVQLGECSGGLTDTDLDCVEALAMADYFLFKTDCEFGRASKPRSHRLYYSDLYRSERKATLQFPDPVRKGGPNAMLLELRCGGGGKGAVSMAPPSLHPSGERVRWDRDGQPKRVDGEELKQDHRDLAAACLLLRYYPRDGVRHNAVLALGGMLARARYEAKWIEWFVGVVAAAAKDDSPNDRRGKEAAGQVAALARRENVSGFRTVAKYWGQEVAEQVADWLGVQAGTTQSATRQQPSAAITAHALQTMEFPPIKFVVPDIIVEGLSIFAGKPKIGKSWMMLELANAVAEGSGSLGGNEPCKQGDVLYCALEDNLRRLQSRMRKLGIQQWSKRLQFRTEMPRLDDGGLDIIEDWIATAECPRLLIIDTLKRVRKRRDDKNSQYDDDYDALADLQGLASKHGIAIVVIHHQRKLDADDPFDTVSGTLGLTASVDSILILMRDSGRSMVLRGRGRDMPEVKKAMQFDKRNCSWRIEGDADEVRHSSERAEIVKAMQEIGAPAAPKEIATESGLRTANVTRLLSRMVRAGDIYKHGHGHYGLRPPGSGDAD